MAIVQKTVKDVPVGIRNMYQKALSVLAKTQNDNLEYGVELLKQVVQKCPGFDEARKKLRAAEKEKTAKLAGFGKFMAQMKSFMPVMKAQGQAAKDPEKAMSLVEEALALNLNNPQALVILASAAKTAKANFIISEAMNIMLEYAPTDANLKKADGFYREINDGRNLLMVRQRLVSLHPKDLELQGLLREAAAMATMEEGEWEKDQTAAQKAAAAAKKSNAAANTNGDRIIRAEEDVKEMISVYEQQIADGNDSVDLRKKLADLYMRISRYEDAINAYQWIVQKLGTLDPAIDRMIEKASIAIYEQQIAQLQQQPGNEAKIQEIRTAIYAYRKERAEDRVRQYPNDLVCKFELAKVYWDGNMVEEALEQFQMSQRNPAHRLEAMTYLGRCFHAKNQNDMAIEQFNKVLSEMPAMTKEKMGTLYYLGVTYDETGNKEKAIDCFKQIYGTDVNFMDVGARINAYYAQNQK